MNVTSFGVNRGGTNEALVGSYFGDAIEVLARSAVAHGFGAEQRLDQRAGSNGLRPVAQITEYAHADVGRPAQKLKKRTGVSIGEQTSGLPGAIAQRRPFTSSVQKILIETTQASLRSPIRP